MKKENIVIETDENLITFIKEKTKDATTDIYEYIYDIIYSILEEEKIDNDKVYISIETVSKEKIKEINKEYRNIDKVTDVLSFPIYDRDEIKLLSKQKEEKKLREIELGDIFLCLDVIEQQAEEYATGVFREVLYMITHGICHLVGYDHMTDGEKMDMRTLEEKTLEKVGVGKINVDEKRKN
ncbi:MAG: rRNA maturation RNase YbeY [Clostridia bacterium]|nr:rRNA maturation RNase YbeY [Clostridia bacterium]